MSPALQADSLPSEPQDSNSLNLNVTIIIIVIIVIISNKIISLFQVLQFNITLLLTENHAELSIDYIFPYKITHVSV